LGKCHQEGDKDGQAIAALSRCVEVEPDRLEAYVDLAVSHTNNMQKDRGSTSFGVHAVAPLKSVCCLAMAALEQWLRHNSKYAAFAPPPLDVKVIVPKQFQLALTTMVSFSADNGR
jgi:hypothetical protein